MEDTKRRRELGLPEQYLYEKDTKAVNYSDFVNKELVLFSNCDNERSIPSMVDGLKPGQRKVLYSSTLQVWQSASFHCRPHLPEEDDDDVSAAEHLEAGNCVLSCLLFVCLFVCLFFILFYFFQVVFYFYSAAFVTLNVMFMTSHRSISLDLYTNFTPALCYINKLSLYFFCFKLKMKLTDPLDVQDDVFNILQVLFTCLKRSDKREIKVAQLAGSVAEHSSYHHGEQSLMSTIVNLAQNFVGSNNINLLQPIGQFGTRLAGGKDSASPRYIFTLLR